VTSTCHTLGRLLVAFFEDYLVGQRGHSTNTIASYSTCIQLLLEFCTQQLHKTHDALVLEDIDVATVLAFLNHLENVRENLPQTRNTRLAAIQTFFRFLASKDPTLLDVCQRICAIKPKKVPHQIQTTLSNEEVTAFLTVCAPSSKGNLRDLALIYLLYNTGARVQELADLKLSDLRLEAPFQVTLTGKGSKQRMVPIWPQTVSALKAYLDTRGDVKPSDFLYINQRAKPISRFGIRYLVRKYKLLAQDLCPTLCEKTVSPHTFRHAAALHMIQSHIDITMVQKWLGHANLNTTNLYVDLDMDMKQEALKVWDPPQQTEVRASWKQPKMVQYLKDLTRQAS
jgi:integrase/recombinase XerD